MGSVGVEMVWVPRTRRRALTWAFTARRGCHDLAMGLRLGYLNRSTSRQLAGVVGSVGGIQGRRDPRATPPVGGAASSASANAAVVGGPGRDRGAGAPAAADATDRDARHPGHDPAVAPSAGGQPLGKTQEEAGTATDTGGSSGAGDTPGQGEPDVGLPPGPRRARRARLHGRTLDGVVDPPLCGTGPGAETVGPDLATVPDSPGRGHRGLRLLPPRDHHPPAALRSSPSSTPPARSGSSASPPTRPGRG